MNTTLGSFEQVTTDTPGTFDFLMRDGEWLFVDNRKTLHARTALANPHASNRLMIRSWVDSRSATAGVGNARSLGA
jgi:hypothetical protein